MLKPDARRVLRCAEPRSRGAGLPCDTPIARSDGAVLVVRCRNCHADHAFRVERDRITWPEDRLPLAPDTTDPLVS